MKSFKELVFPVMYVYSDGRLIFLSDRTLSLSLYFVCKGEEVQKVEFSVLFYSTEMFYYLFSFFFFFFYN